MHSASSRSISKRTNYFTGRGIGCFAGLVAFRTSVSFMICGNAKTISEYIDDVIRLASLSCHEEEIDEQQWKKIASSVRELLVHLRIAILKEISPRSLIRLLIVIFGCLGNDRSTRKIVIHDNELAQLARQSLKSILLSVKVSSVEELLMKSIKDTGSLSASVLDRIICESTNFIAHLHQGHSDDSIHRGPLFRDALIWVTGTAHYPMLSDCRYLSVLHPLCLQLVEDYRHQLKMLGLELLTHLGREISVSTWRMTGRIEATLETLACQRSIHSESVQLCELLYYCLSTFICLLEPTPQKCWNSRFADILLSDLSLEASLGKRIVILSHIRALMDNLAMEIVIHSKRLLRAAELTLLAPRAPSHKAQLRRQEHESFQLQLDILDKFVSLVADALFPHVIWMILPPIIAFVDLEWNREEIDLESNSMREMAQIITRIITKLGGSDPTMLRDTLNMCCGPIPSLKLFLNRCNFL